MHYCMAINARCCCFPSTSLGNNPSCLLISSTSWFGEAGQPFYTEFVKHWSKLLYEDAVSFLLRRWVGTNAIRKWIYVQSFCRGSRDLAWFSFKELEEKSCSSKDLSFLGNKLSLDLKIPHVFHCVHRSTARWKQFSSPLTTTSLLWRDIFSHVVTCLFNALTSMETGCTYINTTEMTYISDLWLIL